MGKRLSSFNYAEYVIQTEEVGVKIVCVGFNANYKQYKSNKVNGNEVRKVMILF
jgi:hypothetical protein